MRIATQIPAASTALTPLGAGAVCPPTAADGGAAANLSNSNLRAGEAAAFTQGKPNVVGRGLGNQNTTANLSDLPCWARNDESRALLAKIAAAQPDRTKPLTETMTGATASFGYRGKEAARLRQMYQAFELERMDWLAECPFPSRQWDNRRQALIDYGKAHGPDALISRVLDHPAGQWAHAA